MRELCLAKTAKRVRRSARGVEVDFVDPSVLSLVGGRREGGAARCNELVEVEEMLTGEGSGGVGCVRGLWGGGPGEVLLESLFEFSSAL